MEWEGASQKPFQKKYIVPITHEHQRWNPLQGGVDGEPEASYHAGNMKFVGLFRQRTAPNWPAVRADREEAAASNFYARDKTRSATIVANRERSGYDVMTSTEVAPHRDAFKPRGRV